MEQFYEEGKVEVGIDEAGRGCLFGPVSVASVIWSQTEPDPNIIIRDSKKMTERQKNIAYDYIMKNAIAVSHKFIHHDEIDKTNILKSTIRGMHLCLDDITKDHEVDTILVDGNQFDFYSDQNDDYINHVCVIDGDNKYKSIACASVIAKVTRDNYIKGLCEENPELKEYDIHNNKGYGTARHLSAIKGKGITEWHRKTYGICKGYL
jgi:ribonuclease HII